MIYKNTARKTLNGLVYVKGKFLKINNKDFFDILELLKKSLLENLNNIMDYKNIEDMKYLKWCYDKLLLNLET